MAHHKVHHKSPKHEGKHPMHESKSKNHGHETSMAHAGYAQGDMSPKVHDYQKPESEFAERGFSKTLEYIERQDKMQSGMCKELNKQAYQGRYS
jgi:hypothetical protein